MVVEIKISLQVSFNNQTIIYIEEKADLCICVKKSLSSVFFFPSHTENPTHETLARVIQVLIISA